MWMRLSIRTRVVVTALAIAGAAVAAPGASTTAPDAIAVPNTDAAIVHTLNRLAFGPRPGAVAAIKQMGLERWIAEQLDGSSRPDEALEARLARLTTLTLDARTIAVDYFLPARRERQARQRTAVASPDATDMTMTPGVGRATPSGNQPGRTARPMPADASLARGRAIFTELSEAKVLRAVYSERQLEAVLADFWFNHFNVFARKGQTEIYVGEFERDVIRPHVLGRFRDLLGATAKSPAMLFYLDNWMNAAPDLSRRNAARAVRRPNATAPPQPMARGLNENYARELLELHTLGVDGGYTQDDVVAVARAFTGWSIGRPEQAGFRFVPALHDRAAKTVLGQQIPAGAGIEDGERVLDLLAAHPATARHIAFKLAQRFVSDAPPDDLVDRAAAVFTRTGGNLREVVRAIVTSPEFFAPAAHRAKVKTPFEFVVSALRATNADVQSAVTTTRALAGLGMPLYLCQPPTGYDETAETWVSSGALVNRMNFAVALANGQLRGVRPLPLARVRRDHARTHIVADALSGQVSPATAQTLDKAVTSPQVIALAIGSPEFQRQ